MHSGSSSPYPDPSDDEFKDCIEQLIIEKTPISPFILRESFLSPAKNHVNSSAHNSLPSSNIKDLRSANEIIDELRKENAELLQDNQHLERLNSALCKYIENSLTDTVTITSGVGEQLHTAVGTIHSLEREIVNLKAALAQDTESQEHDPINYSTGDGHMSFLNCKHGLYPCSICWSKKCAKQSNSDCKITIT